MEVTNYQKVIDILNEVEKVAKWMPHEEGRGNEEQYVTDAFTALFGSGNGERIGIFGEQNKSRNPQMNPDNGYIDFNLFANAQGDRRMPMGRIVLKNGCMHQKQDNETENTPVIPAATQIEVISPDLIAQLSPDLDLEEDKSLIKTSVIKEGDKQITIHHELGTDPILAIDAMWLPLVRERERAAQQTAQQQDAGREM